VLWSRWMLNNRAFCQIMYLIFSFENSIGTALRKAAGKKKHLWNSSKWDGACDLVASMNDTPAGQGCVF
jgi:hypothetical protein